MKTFQDYECERDEDTRQFIQEEIERSTQSFHGKVTVINFQWGLNGTYL